MKKIKLSFLLAIVATSLVACGSSGGVEKADFNKVNELFDGGDGYLLVFLDNDNEYLDQLKDSAAKNNKQILSYNPYKKDGEHENNKPAYPDEDVKGNALYHVENGEIKDSVDVSIYKGTELEKELDLLFQD